MKLYRAKIPTIAQQTVKVLVEEEDIEVAPENREEAEEDFVAIMEEYLRRDQDVRSRVKDFMHARRLPYDKYGRVRGQIAEELGHPLGDDVQRYLARQFLENMMISPFVEEVWSEDEVIRRKILDVLAEHHVDEREIREEAIGKIKNVEEGTVDYEIALRNAMRDVRKRRGLT